MDTTPAVCRNCSRPVATAEELAAARVPQATMDALPAEDLPRARRINAEAALEATGLCGVCAAEALAAAAAPRSALYVRATATCEAADPDAQRRTLEAVCFAVTAVDTTDAEQHAAAGLLGAAERLDYLVAPPEVLRGLLIDELGGKVRTPSAAVRFVADSLEHLARTKWAEGQSRTDHDAQRETALHVGQADFRSAALLRHLADLLDLNARPAGAVQPEAQGAGVP